MNHLNNLNHLKFSPFILFSLQLLILALFIIIIYLPGINGNFVFDDIYNILINAKIHANNFNSTFDALNSPISKTRPLAMFSFANNHWLGGLNTFGYHLFNIIIHIINTALLLWLNNLIIADLSITNKINDYQKRQLAFWGSALWALNPVQVHSVTYIVQRMTALATTFYLLAIIGYFYYRRERISIVTTTIIISVCFMLGMASKEIVITLPFSLLLIAVIFDNKITRSLIIKLSCGALIILIILGWFYLPHNWLTIFFNKLPGRNFSSWERLLTESRVLWYYLSLLFLPLPERLKLTHDEYPISSSLLDPPTTILSILGLVILLISAQRLKNRAPLLAFAILFFLLASSLEASFVNLEIAFIHRLYLPSLFIPLGLLSIIPLRYYLKLTPVILLLILSLAFATQRYNEIWTMNINLWQKEAKYGDQSVRTLFNLALSLNDLGRETEAIPILEQILPRSVTKIDRLKTLIQLGRANYYRNRCDLALPYLEMIKREFFHEAQARFIQGLCLAKAGKITEANDIAHELIADQTMQYHGIIIQAQIARQENDQARARLLITNTLTKLNDKQIPMRNLLLSHLADLELAANNAAAAYQIYLTITNDDPDNYFAWLQIYRMKMAANDRDNAATIKRFLVSRGIKID